MQSTKPKKRRARTTTRVDYQTYIASDAWIARRQRFFAKYARQCHKCGSTERIHLHHATYRRITQEWDSDLVPLCEPCHVALHKYHRAGKKTLRKATMNWLGVDFLGGYKKR